MKLLARLEKSRDVWFLLAVSFFFFLLRLPSLFEPYWYGDEAIYEVMAVAMQNGRLLYQGIWDNKPPLLYVLYFIFSGDQFSLRLLSLLFGLGSVIGFFILCTKLLKTQKIVFISTSLFALLFGLPYIEGNIANAENFMLLPIIVAGIFVVTYPARKKPYFLILAGLLLGLAFLVKAVAVFDTIAFGLFLFILTYKKIRFVPLQIKMLIPLISAFLIPLIITSIIFFLTGAFSDFFNAAFRQNIGYVGYGNTFIISNGFLLVKLALLLVTVVMIYIKRKNLSASALFILLWLSFSVFNAFFSQRPYTHYVLVLLPSVILSVGLWLTNFSTREKNRRLQVVSGLLLLLLCIIIYKSFHFYGKTNTYYQNFWNFITGQKSISAYQRFFDKNTPIDYMIAAFINRTAKADDSIFVWGNNAMIYKLTNKLPLGKYTVAYHMTQNKESLQETTTSIETKKPRFIIVMPNQPSLPFSLSNYQPVRYIDTAIIYERNL